VSVAIDRVAFLAVAMRMRQSLSELEQQFAREMEADRARRDSLYREAEHRSRTRHKERTRKHSSLRFFLLVAVLIATAVLVTVAMFQTLYIVMG